MAKNTDLIGYVYRYRVFLSIFIILAMPVTLFLLYMDSPTTADSPDDVYSIYIIAGQSQAEGSNTIRNVYFPETDTQDARGLPDDSTGFYKRYYPDADSATKFWWAGADGVGPTDDFLTFIQFQAGINPAGWVQSGGNAVGNNGSLRMKTLMNGQTRNGLDGFNEVVGPEFGIGRSLYDKGKRKVIILKVSYGFQALAQTNSTVVPFDWNTESVSPSDAKMKSYAKLKSEFEKLTTYIKSPSGLNAKYSVDGFFWTQGGTDTLQQSFADAYESNFRNLVTKARSDFQMHPDAHFVAAKIGYQWCVDHSYPVEGAYCGIPWAKKLEPSIEFRIDQLAFPAINDVHPDYLKRLNLVRDSIQKVADEFSWVDTMEIGDQRRSNDNLHYSEIGQLNIGKRFTNMYRMPFRIDTGNEERNGRTLTATNFDGDGIPNSSEDTGRGLGCLQFHGKTLVNNGANNGNLSDDDTDCDGFPNYVDAINGPGSGL